MNTEEIYNELISLLEYIREKKKVTDFITYTLKTHGKFYQNSYLSSLGKKRADSGYIRKGDPESNKEIIEYINEFLEKNNL